MSDLTTTAAVRYRDTFLTVGNIRSAEAWDAANDGLAAIEAEAVAAERARIAAAVQEMPGSGRTGSGYGGNIDRMVWATDEFVSRAAVLTIVEEP